MHTFAKNEHVTLFILDFWDFCDVWDENIHERRIQCQWYESWKDKHECQQD